MKLVFLGTRGYIEERSRRHFRHTSLLVKHRGRRVMIDCGADWAGRIGRLRPDAIVITHAHPDHADGLRAGPSCPVYATQESWRALKQSPVADRHVMRARTTVDVFGIVFEAFPVVHSLRAPAVGYRISNEKSSIFYVPDVVFIPDHHAALSDVILYVGDGATLTRPLVRRHGNKLFGHTTVRAQLSWCEKESVPWAIFTHCGSQIVAGDGRKIASQVRAMGRDHGVKAQIAHDGMTVDLRARSPQHRGGPK